MTLDDFNLLTLFIHHLNLSGNLAVKSKYETVGLDVNYYFEERHNALYIHFEGSNSATDWVRNFLFAKQPYKEMSFPFKVHRGFLGAWKEVKDIIFDKVMTLEKYNTYKYKKIVVVGYSHGGGLAILAHEFIRFYRPDLKEDLITIAYEAPKVIAQHPKEIEDRWFNCYLIKNANDIVTRVPPKLFGYDYVGHLVQIGNKKDIEKYKWWPKCVLAHTPDELCKSLRLYEKRKVYNHLRGINDET